MEKKLRILFMGSPEFAAHSLRILIDGGIQVVGVITGPDRKKGRGQQISESEVKIEARKHKLPIFQPANLKDDDFRKEIEKLNADLGVVVAFRMLPESIWNLPKLGTINLHASLLPDYRGAAPINWAIINGEKESGITTFFLKHIIDTGDIILQKKVAIDDQMNAGSLHDQLMEEGAHLLLETVKKIESGDYEVQDQLEMLNHIGPIHNAPKIFKEDCQITWNKPAEEVRNLIRGLSPYPTAWTKILTSSGKEYIFKIYTSEKSGKRNQKQPGNCEISSAKFYIGCADDYLEITEVQLEGKQRMKTADFLRGFSMDNVQIVN